MRMGGWFCGLALWAALVDLPTAQAAEPPVPVILMAGSAAPFFVPTRDGCDGNDVPDAPARALRAADGTIRLFGLHYTNHFLEGPSFDALRIMCRSALPSRGNADPAAYDDKSWIAATWTRDGRVVEGLVHHEFQADSHPGLCRFPDYMRCWFNTVLAVRSIDGGADFVKTAQPVVASAPFPQEVEQGRHRGFFNPSNMFGDGRFTYFMASTTGWAGQDNGVCLFRTATPDDPQSWRAYDGAGFTIGYADPYRSAAVPFPRACAPIKPFPAPVGSVVRQRGTGLWLAVFQAAGDGNDFPLSGFYAAASRDLLQWSAPRLIVAGVTNYEDPCKSGGRVIAYPSLIDPDAESRNFDDVGAKADLFYTSMAAEGCTLTASRVMMRQSVSVAFRP